MSLQFDSFVKEHSFTLKCCPRSDYRQKIENLTVLVYPKGAISSTMDSFGNRTIYGYAQNPHEHFSFLVSGNAVTGISDYVPVGENSMFALFKYHTRYTTPGPHIREFAKKFVFSPDTRAYDKAVTFMEGIYDNFCYVPNVTTMQTTAEDAIALGKGVCQDYSHILLSLCRMEHIPSRYVAGMMVGEGVSHAWVEICDGGRWFQLDPTNRVVVTDSHIKISSGRDCSDCIINQGVFTGRVRQRQMIKVRVDERQAPAADAMSDPCEQ